MTGTDHAGTDDVGLSTEESELVKATVGADPAANGVPDPVTAARRRRAAALVTRELADVLRPEGLRASALGAAWSTDLDAHVTRFAEAARLRAAGWLPLDGLLGAMGERARGRWAVTDEAGRVIGALDQHLEPLPDPLAGVFRRCRRAGRVRLREVLELRRLVGGAATAGDDSVVSPADQRVLEAAADIEAGLGGGALTRWRTGRVLTAPAPLSDPLSALRRRVAAARTTLRPRIVVALSGVDGAGKSTLAALLREELERAGVPSSRVWARPGNHLHRLSGVARLAKRALRMDPTPGVERVAAGQVPARATSSTVAKGWTLLVTAAFMVDAWSQHLKSRGVVVWDRHVLDAVATLEFVYDVHGPLSRRLVAGVLPRATLSVYLDVPPDVAVARKPGDVLGDLAVRAQLESYRRLLGTVPDCVVVDATRPPDEVARTVLRELVSRTRRAEHDR